LRDTKVIDLYGCDKYIYNGIGTKIKAK